MRIHQMSDLHLEFNHKFRATNPCGADILMLNGDICVANYLTRSKDSPKAFLGEIILDFFAKAAEAYSYVVYIPGNHEHYHGVYINTVDILKNALSHLPNVFILQNFRRSTHFLLFLFLSCSAFSLTLLNNKRRHQSVPNFAIAFPVL